MTVLVIMTGICAAAVLFLLRFLVALFRECKPKGAVHLLSVAPAPSGGDESDPGEVPKQLTLADQHTVRRRDLDSPAASIAPRNSIRVASRLTPRPMKGQSA